MLTRYPAHASVQLSSVLAVALKFANALKFAVALKFAIANPRNNPNRWKKTARH